MWITALQITACVVVFVLVAFIAGKRIGQRRFIKVQEEMKALELSFNQLLEELDLVSNHNLKILENKTEKLKELLEVVDGKCLYVHDLLKEMDDGTEKLKDSEPIYKGDQTSIAERKENKRFRNEFKLAFDELAVKVLNQDKIINTMHDTLKQHDFEQIKEFFRNEMIVEIDNRLENLQDNAKKYEFAKKTIKKVAADRATETEIELKEATINDNIRLPLPVKKTDLQVDKTPESREPVSITAPGTPVYEVVKQLNEGVTIPQIARNTGMGKGKIELIIKLYGSEVKLRNQI